MHYTCGSAAPRVVSGANHVLALLHNTKCIRLHCANILHVRVPMTILPGLRFLKRVGERMHPHMDMAVKTNQT